MMSVSVDSNVPGFKLVKLVVEIRSERECSARQEG